MGACAGSMHAAMPLGTTLLREDPLRVRRTLPGRKQWFEPFRACSQPLPQCLPSRSGEVLCPGVLKLEESKYCNYRKTP